MSFEHSLKNAYIGKVIEKSVDLRGKTLAEVQAEWWDIAAFSWSYILGSDWLKNGTTSNNVVFLSYYLPEALTSSNKIKIHITWHRTRNAISWNYNYIWWQDIGLINTIANSWINFISWNYRAWNNGDNTWINYYYNNVLTTLSSVWPNNVWGDTDLTFELDLSDGSMTFNITSPTTWTWTWTLSASQLSYVLWLRYVYFRTINLNSSNSNYGLIKTIDLTIS